MKLDLGNLTAKVERYKGILQNTLDYRALWEPEVKPLITKTLRSINKKVKLGGKIEINDNMENLGVIILNLGKEKSGISEFIPDSDIKRSMIKSNGALIFQQLFNGKIMVMVLPPHIEGYGEPRPPKNLEIVRPHELTPGYILRYVDQLISEVTTWEDYDDDQPTVNKIGFGNQQLILDGAEEQEEE